MLRFAFASALAALAMVGVAKAAVVDLDSLATGSAFDGFTVAGATATVTTVSDRSPARGGTNQAVIFDSANYTGRDDDLQAPFEGAPGSGLPDLNPGKILVIAGPPRLNLQPGSAGLTPDDDAEGGTITFSFDRKVNFNAFNYFDFETDSRLDVATDLGTVATGLETGDNRWAAFDQGSPFLAGIRTITFTFAGSGAIDSFDVTAVPLPGSLALLLGAFGGLAMLRRKAG